MPSSSKGPYSSVVQTRQPNLPPGNSKTFKSSSLSQSLEHHDQVPSQLAQGEEVNNTLAELRTGYENIRQQNNSVLVGNQTNKSIRSLAVKPPAAPSSYSPVKRELDNPLSITERLARLKMVGNPASL